MPALSSFISYRPKRKAKQGTFKISSPFPIKFLDAMTSPHPYASPRVLDIQDHRALAASSNGSESTSNYHTSSTSTPRVHLDVEIDPEKSLADWFGPNFHDSGSPFKLTYGEISSGASGSRTHIGYESVDGRRVNRGASMGDGEDGSDREEEYDEDEESYTHDSAEEVLANLEAMDVRYHSYCDDYWPCSSSTRLPTLAISVLMT